MTTAQSTAWLSWVNLGQSLDPSNACPSAMSINTSAECVPSHLQRMAAQISVQQVKTAQYVWNSSQAKRDWSFSSPSYC